MTREETIKSTATIFEHGRLSELLAVVRYLEREAKVSSDSHEKYWFTVAAHHLRRGDHRAGITVDLPEEPKP